MEKEKSEASSLTKEQLLDYVKKQKIKIKKLESSNAALISKEEDYKKQLFDFKSQLVEQSANSTAEVDALAAVGETVSNFFSTSISTASVDSFSSFSASLRLISSTARDISAADCFSRAAYRC